MPTESAGNPVLLCGGPADGERHLVPLEDGHLPQFIAWLEPSAVPFDDFDAHMAATAPMQLVHTYRATGWSNGWRYEHDSVM